MGEALGVEDGAFTGIIGGNFAFAEEQKED
jgi:hypothetical protein